jgi:hypothetical protein
MQSQSSIPTPPTLNNPGVTPVEFLLDLAPMQQYFLPPNTALLAPLTKFDCFFAMAIIEEHKSLPVELMATASVLGRRINRG